jgi:tetratricopeptide (TPR) repeat protein
VLAAAGHAERLGVAGEQAGSLLYEASAYLRGRGVYRQARPVAEWALALTEAALGPDHPHMATWRNDLGLVLRALGDLEGARVQMERALAIGEAALGPDHPYVAIRRNNLGGVLRELGDLEGARVQMERALAIGEAALGTDYPAVAGYPQQPRRRAPGPSRTHLQRVYRGRLGTFLNSGQCKRFTH